MESAVTCDLVTPQIPSDLLTTGHVMPGFQYNLVGVSPMCGANFTGTFSKHAVNIYSPTVTPLITGWRETDGPCFWLMYLLPNPEEVPQLSSDLDAPKTSLQAFSAYNLPIVEALVWYFHAPAGFPVRNTWFKASKAGNFVSWPGLSPTRMKSIPAPLPIRPSRYIWFKCAKGIVPAPDEKN